MTKTQRLALRLATVCALVVVLKGATHLPRALAAKPPLRVLAKATEIQSKADSRPPAGSQSKVLEEDANILPRHISHAISLALTASLSMVLLLAVFLFTGERRLRRRRERLRKTYQLGEEVLQLSSSKAILERICESLPGILSVSTAHLYVYNRATNALESVESENREATSISLSSPPEGAASGVVACFQDRTLLSIPKIEPSVFPFRGRQHPAKSLLFVPMEAQGDLAGVLQLDEDDRTRVFTSDDQEIAQHLGNQTGVALRLLNQRSMQEQLFRTEKLAAVGRLISSVVNELQEPLSSISDSTDRALEKSRAGPAEREVSAIAAEVKKASDMVARLVSFAPTERVEAQPVSITAVLQNLIKFREGDWKASGIRVRNLTTREPLFVLGLQGQMEQVFLNLLVHAEQLLASAPQKLLTIRTSLLARRLLVEISFTAPSKAQRPGETAAILGITRTVIAGHGGDVRLIDKRNANSIFEVELPVVSTARVGAAQTVKGLALPGRTMTVLVIEPEENSQRQIRDLLAARGYRVVPVNNSDTGLDLAHRVRFDMVFVSVHAPGLNWIELSENLQSRVGGFVLLPDTYDGELAADFEGDSRFVLPKPVQEIELDGVLQSIERTANSHWHVA